MEPNDVEATYTVEEWLRIALEKANEQMAFELTSDQRITIAAALLQSYAIQAGSLRMQDCVAAVEGLQATLRDLRDVVSGLK